MTRGDFENNLLPKIGSVIVMTLSNGHYVHRARKFQIIQSENTDHHGEFIEEMNWVRVECFSWNLLGNGIVFRAPIFHVKTILMSDRMSPGSSRLQLSCFLQAALDWFEVFCFCLRITSGLAFTSNVTAEGISLMKSCSVYYSHISCLSAHIHHFNWMQCKMNYE